MKMKCMVANHKQVMSDHKEICLTCIENDVVRLRAYLQRGVDLLDTLDSRKEVSDFRKRATTVLCETIGT